MDVPHVFHTRIDSGLEVPRPFRSGLTLASVGALPLLAGAAGLIRPLYGLVFAAGFVCAGVLHAVLADRGRARLRRRADRELRLGRRIYFSPALVSWRSAELVSERHRRSLARMVARTERDLSPATLPNATPLNRIAARPHIELFHQLIERIAALDSPIQPRGVLLVEELLSSPDSPLYRGDRAGELRASLVACIDALDALPEAVPAATQQGIPAGRRHKVQPATATNDAAEARLRGTTTRSRLRKGRH